jgi:hypothetical protein
MHLRIRNSLVVLAATAAAGLFLGAGPASASTTPQLVRPAAAAPQASYNYYAGNTGGAARHASNIYVYQTSDSASAPDGQVVCVQEHVYPNWPSTSGSFFDTYRCGNGVVNVSLNGANVDQAYCWVNGATTYLSCSETY